MPSHSKHNKWVNPEKVDEIVIKKEVPSDSKTVTHGDDQTANTDSQAVKVYELKKAVVKLKCLDASEGIGTDGVPMPSMKPIFSEIAVAEPEPRTHNEDQPAPKQVDRTICKKTVSINIHRLKLHNAQSVKLSPEMLKKLEK